MQEQRWEGDYVNMVQCGDCDGTGEDLECVCYAVADMCCCVEPQPTACHWCQGSGWIGH